MPILEFKKCITPIKPFNRFAVKLFYLHLHPLEVVFRYRDPQLQMDEMSYFGLIWNP